MHQNSEIRNIALNLEMEDLEAKAKPGCCGSSSTSPLCTCPIRFTDCCAMVELTES